MRRIILGPDQMLARRARDRALADSDPSGLSIDRYDASTPAATIRDSLATVGFFGTGRVVLAQGLVERIQRELAGRKASGGDSQVLSAAVAGTDANTLILYEPTLDKLPAWLRTGLPASVVVEEFAIPRGRDLTAWVKREAKAAGGAIEDAAAQRLLERVAPGRWQAPNRNPAFDVPPDLLALANEVRKLCAYAEGPISTDDVDRLVAVTDEDRMFPLIDAVTSGDAPSTWRELASLEGDDDVGRAYNQLMTTLELGAVTSRAGAGSNLTEVAKELGLKNPNRLTQIARKPQSVTTGLAVTADRLFKTGRIDGQQAALDWLSLETQRGRR